MNHKKPHTLSWFERRIGKRIYRNKTTCECSDCKDVVDNGIVVTDKNHAQYLFDVQNDMMIEYYETSQKSTS